MTNMDDNVRAALYGLPRNYGANAMGGLLGMPQGPQGAQGGLLAMPDAQPMQMGAAPDASQGMNATPAPSLLQRLEQRIMAVPESSQSLLSGGDVAHARQQGLLHAGLSMLANSRGAPGQNAPGFGQAVAAGLGAMQQGFQGDMANTVQQGQLAQAIQQQKAQIAQAQLLQSQRAAIQQKYAPQPGETMEQTKERMRGMISDYAAIGDHEMLGKLNTIAPEVFKEMTPKEQKALEKVDGGTLGTFMVDPHTGKTVATLPYKADPNRGGGGMGNPMQEFRAGTTLVRDYNHNTQPQQQAALAYGTIQSLAPRALAGEGMAQTDLVRAAVKLQHPSAIVRPGEMLTVEETRGWPDALQKMAGRIQGGSLQLAPAQVRSILNISNDIVKEHQTRLQQVREAAIRRGETVGLTDQDFTDPFASLPGAGASAPPAAVGPDFEKAKTDPKYAAWLRKQGVKF